MGSANVDAASVKNLSVKWASGAVNIDVVDEGDAIELVETAPRGMTKAQQMRWSVNGDTLSIDYGTWFSCFALGRKDLQVRIPKSCAQNLGAVEIDGASGDYDVNGLGCETLKLKLASGDVDGQNLQADELRVDVASTKPGASTTAGITTVTVLPDLVGPSTYACISNDSQTPT